MIVKVPDSWDEVSIGQFQEIAELSKESKDHSLTIASILLDKDPEEIRKYDPRSSEKIVNHLSWIGSYPNEGEYKQSLFIDDVEYRLIENLNGFSGGEWWDMEEYLLDFNANIHLIFAMLYRPLNDVYNNVECKKRAELFQDKIMIGDVYGSLVFFSLVVIKSIPLIQDYLATNRKTTQEKPKKKSWKGLLKKLKRERSILSGTGITTSMS